jgi:hypothetical protein
MEPVNFGLLLLGGVRIPQSTSSPIDLSTAEVAIKAHVGVSEADGVISSLLREDNNPWPSWLGDIIWKDIKNPVVTVEASISTETSEAGDQESKIKDELRKAALALQITTAEAAKRRFILTGEKIDGQIYSYVELAPWVPPSLEFLQNGERWPFYLGCVDLLGEKASFNSDDENILLHFAECHCNKWRDILHALRKMQNNPNLARLKNGLTCFRKACSERFINFRLPNFVRSLEALVYPRHGGKEFVERVTRWWPNLSLLPLTKESKEDRLKKIWRLRNKYVHMKPTDPNRSTNDILRLSFECEAVARKAYQDVLLNADKLEEVQKWWPEKEHDMLSINGQDE